jgi:hypothetical protein
VRAAEAPTDHYYRRNRNDSETALPSKRYFTAISSLAFLPPNPQSRLQIGWGVRGRACVIAGESGMPPARKRFFLAIVGGMRSH